VLSLVIGLNLIALISWESVRWWWTLVSVASLVGFVLGRAQPRLLRTLPWLWGASLPIGLLLLMGVAPEGGLRTVDTREWGGFMLTLILSGVGIGVSFPLGIALALGRRSQLPAIKYFCIGFIEIVRGAPLITWLFIASLMVPLIFNISPDRIGALERALVAITLFSAAYMAENVRGGLQAVAKGQSEAARALGLSGWQTMRLIVLPQALRAVIPAIVGQAIGLFKDTSLVFIVGLFDFFNIQNIVANQPGSLQVPGGIRLELSLFLALVYWFFAFRMSVASRQLEKQLGVGIR
jgi:general L-amino acid transport system permease protein